MKSLIHPSTLILAALSCFAQSCSIFGQETESNAQKLGADKAPVGQHEHTNALKKETSPYLLLHAHNPVNWYGWGEEALQLAKKEKKLIFLSIGYSSCHWCHVMERESFMDDEIAKFLNDNFVCIKVDREERPDVDAIYMQSLRIVNPRTGGGWPLSMFLTPDAKPFFGGTYFPARDGDRGARLGFLSIVKRIHTAWLEKAGRINKDADYVVKQLQNIMSRDVPAEATLDETWSERCVANLQKSFDPEYGGFSYDPSNANRPKFPEPSNLIFLAQKLRADSSNSQLKKMFVETCERMMMGGILDHIGGGFHRYSVDRFWRIPHFEKMLYDNGQLATVYAQAYELTGRQDFRVVVEELIEFVMREMRDSGGAFYAALDAESEGVEGKFYRWELAEIESTLDSDEIEVFSKVYGLDRPNFEGRYYVPQLRMTMSDNAKELGIESADLINRMQMARKKLSAIRAKRPRPLTDTKILSSWNGMMIRGLADAGRIFKNEEYVAAASKAANFVLSKMVDDSGRLFRTHTDGISKLNAYLPDYANVIEGLLALHQATDQDKWLQAAARLQETQNKLFWDDLAGGYFYTSNDHESLLARAKRVNDGPVPSGNSVSANNLVVLSTKLNKPEFTEMSRKTALNAWELLKQIPSASPRMVLAAEELVKIGSDNSD